MKADRFERLYSEHAERLFAFLAYRTGSAALAEDLLADVFERVLRARRSYDPRKGSETTWLYAIAMNRLRDDRRRASAERRALERYVAGPAAAPDMPEDRVLERDRVLRALDLVTEQEREILALRFGADLTAPQIAKVVGEPLTTVEGRLYRGLRRLRTVLEEEAATPLAQRAL